MNIIQLAGYVGNTPESRVTPGGQSLLTFRLGVPHRKDKTVWFQITFWNPERIKGMIPYLSKGSAVIIYGELQEPSTYVNRDGITVVKLEIYADILRFSPFGKAKKEDDRSVFPKATNLDGAGGDDFMIEEVPF